MKFFRDLNEEETKQFQQWARNNYVPGTIINEVWHPVVVAECKLINGEQGQANVYPVSDILDEPLYAAEIETGDVYYIDLPNPMNFTDDASWVNVATFDTKSEALEFAQKHLGADEEGKISVISC